MTTQRRTKTMSNFQTLDVTALETITGGKATRAGSSSSSSSDLTAQLTSLQSSISDLSKNNNKKSGLFGNPTNAILFAMVAMKGRDQSPNVVLVR
ncbi:MAG: ComC/BlpC family leader-containing pheromone/bacteriocin [Kofleriaceae bacterium]